MDNADIYSASRQELVALAATLDGAQTDRAVQALPGWTVHDAYAHLVGLCADIVDGRMDGAGSPEWSDRQVRLRSSSSLATIVGEWEARGPELDRWLDEQDDRSTMFVIFDVWNHQQDIRSTVGEPRALDDARVAYIVDRAWPSYESRYATLGAPPLRIVGTRKSYLLGSGEPDATLRADDYELLRILFGRRSRAQIERTEWSADPAPYIDAIHLFDLPERDLRD
jgi:uncharacterized protein (TIGR03083 family)